MIKNTYARYGELSARVVSAELEDAKKNRCIIINAAVSSSHPSLPPSQDRLRPSFVTRPPLLASL